jgi:hypothetical protein
MSADVRRLVVRELIGLIVVFAVLIATQLAFDDLAPVWALVLFAVGWVAFRVVDALRRHGKGAPPTV